MNFNNKSLAAAAVAAALLNVALAAAEVKVGLDMETHYGFVRSRTGFGDLFPTPGNSGNTGELSGFASSKRVKNGLTTNGLINVTATSTHGEHLTFGAYANINANPSNTATSLFNIGYGAPAVAGGTINLSPTQHIINDGGIFWKYKTGNWSVKVTAGPTESVSGRYTFDRRSYEHIARFDLSSEAQTTGDGTAANPTVIQGGLWTASRMYLLSSGLPSNNMPAFGEDNYFANRVKAVFDWNDDKMMFSAGVGFTRDTSVRGTAFSLAMANTHLNAVKNMVTAGMEYGYTLDEGLSIGFAASGEFGSPKSRAAYDLMLTSGGAQLTDANHPLKNRNNVKAWELGAKVGYKGFSTAVTYGSWNKSLQYDPLTSKTQLVSGVAPNGNTVRILPAGPVTNDNGKHNSKYSALNVGYEFEYLDLGFRFFTSKKSGDVFQSLYLPTTSVVYQYGQSGTPNKYQDYSFTAGFKLAPGVKVAATVGMANFADFTNNPTSIGAQAAPDTAANNPDTAANKGAAKVGSDHPSYVLLGLKVRM